MGTTADSQIKRRVSGPVRYIPVGLTLLVGPVVSLVLFGAVSQWKQGATRAEFERAASDHVADMTVALEPSLFVLRSLASLYAGSDKVERSEFHKAVKFFLPHFQSVQAIEWVPRVSEADRKSYEMRARDDGFRDFEFIERTPEGHVARALGRDEYYPVYYVEPYEGNEKALGYDVGSEANRRQVMAKARDTGRMAATQRIRLVQETGGQWGVLVFHPVYRNGAPAETVEERRANLEGFVLAVFRVGDLVESAERTRASDGTAFSVCVFDAAAPAGEQFLLCHTHGAGPYVGQASPLEECVVGGLRHVGTLAMADRRWEVVCTPSPQWLAEHGSRESWAVLGGGLFLTGLLATYFLMCIRREGNIRRLAAQLIDANHRLSDQAGQLTRANDALQDEVADRERAERALRATGEFQKKLLDTAAAAIFTVDAERRITDANAAFFAATGFSAEEILGKLCGVLRGEPCTQKCGLFDPNSTLPIVKKACTILTKDGRRLDILKGADLLRDESGGMTGGIESFMDVTEMVKAREGIEEVNRRLEELATTDPLTGLWNRRHFVETLDAEIARSRRYGADLALLMVDVDQFKSINDSCGHLYGDRVLVEAARLLRNEARDNDIVARYAGDEFMVLMPNTTAEQAMNAAERVRAKAAERRISDERHTVRLTFSVGVAAIGPASDLPPEQIARAADEALYAAKHGGRNCIRMWSQVVDDPQADAELDGEAVKLLERKVEELSARSQDLFLDSLHGLVQALDARDPYMRCHSENVTRYAVAVARTMGLETEEVGVIRRAAMMHDIGKIGVPDAILQNTGPLSDQDRKVMRQHPLIGVRILSHMRVLEREIPLIRHHHERWNGEGYPDNIAGTAIPLGARILAVADAFDAITSDRVYRKGVGRPEAIERLVEQSGKQFDPVVVDALVQWLRSGADAPEETAAAGAPPGGLPNECLN